MKVIITGSHFSPAYAVIRKSKWDIVVVGRKYALSNTQKESFEYKLCKEKKIPFRVLDVPRFLRVSPVRSFLSSISLFKAIKKARNIIKEENCDIVLSFGGYTALPVVIAARTLRKPVIIHEQTLGAGFSNKISSYFADRILISFSSSRKYFPKNKTYLTGNPIREELLSLSSISPLVKTVKPIIYVTGGSTGSMAINDLIGKIFPSLSDYFIIHQYGVSESEIKGENYLGKSYFSPSEVAWIMRNASLIISRSGINTVTEVLYLRLPAIFIPLPHGQKNEQLKNARYAQKNARATYFIQEKIVPREILREIRDKIRKGRSTKENEAIQKSAKATDLIINETEKLYKKTQEKRSKGAKNI